MPGSIQSNFWNAVFLQLSQSDIQTNATLLCQVDTLMDNSKLGEMILNPNFTNPLANATMLTTSTNLINASGLTSGQKTALVASITSPV